MITNFTGVDTHIYQRLVNVITPLPSQEAKPIKEAIFVNMKNADAFDKAFYTFKDTINVSTIKQADYEKALAIFKDSIITILGTKYVATPTPTPAQSTTSNTTSNTASTESGK